MRAHRCGRRDHLDDRGGLSKLFDVQTNRLTVVSCTNCGYSELYRDVGSTPSDLVDIFFG